MTFLSVFLSWPNCRPSLSSFLKVPMIRLVCALAFSLIASTAFAQLWNAPPEPTARGLMTQPLEQSYVGIATLPWTFQTALGAMEETGQVAPVLSFTQESIGVLFADGQTVSLPIPDDIKPVQDPAMTAYDERRSVVYGVDRARKGAIYGADIYEETVQLVAQADTRDFGSVVYQRDVDNGDRLIFSGSPDGGKDASFVTFNLSNNEWGRIPVTYDLFPGIVERHGDRKGPGLTILAIDQDDLLIQEVGSNFHHVLHLPTLAAQAVDMPAQ